MRARYFSQNLRRFVNADVIIGSIDLAVTLNRYAYANANPVSFVDPLGLTPDEKGAFLNKSSKALNPVWSVVKDFGEGVGNVAKTLATGTENLLHTLWLSTEFDFGVGFGFGVATSVELADVAGLGRYDPIVLQKEAGQNYVVVGQAEEVKVGIAAFFSEFFSGYQTVTDFEGNTIKEDSYEPSFNFSTGVGASAYLFVGLTAYVGINWEVFLEESFNIDI